MGQQLQTIINSAKLKSLGASVQKDEQLIPMLLNQIKQSEDPSAVFEVAAGDEWLQGFTEKHKIKFPTNLEELIDLLFNLEGTSELEFYEKLRPVYFPTTIYEEQLQNPTKFQQLQQNFNEIERRGFIYSKDNCILIQEQENDMKALIRHLLKQSDQGKVLVLTQGIKETKQTSDLLTFQEHGVNSAPITYKSAVNILLSQDKCMKEINDHRVVIIEGRAFLEVVARGCLNLKQFQYLIVTGFNFKIIQQTKDITNQDRYSRSLNKQFFMFVKYHYYENTTEESKEQDFAEAPRLICLQQLQNVPQEDLQLMKNLCVKLKSVVLPFDSDSIEDQKVESLPSYLTLRNQTQEQLTNLDQEFSKYQMNLKQKPQNEVWPLKGRLLTQEHSKSEFNSFTQDLGKIVSELKFQPELFQELRIKDTNPSKLVVSNYETSKTENGYICKISIPPILKKAFPEGFITSRQFSKVNHTINNAYFKLLKELNNLGFFDKDLKLNKDRFLGYLKHNNIQFTEITRPVMSDQMKFLSKLENRQYAMFTIKTDLGILNYGVISLLNHSNFNRAEFDIPLCQKSTKQLINYLTFKDEQDKALGINNGDYEKILQILEKKKLNIVASLQMNTETLNITQVNFEKDIDLQMVKFYHTWTLYKKNNAYLQFIKDLLEKKFTFNPILRIDELKLDRKYMEKFFGDLKQPAITSWSPLMKYEGQSFITPLKKDEPTIDYATINNEIKFVQELSMSLNKLSFDNNKFTINDVGEGNLQFKREIEDLLSANLIDQIKCQSEIISQKKVNKGRFDEDQDFEFDYIHTHISIDSTIIHRILSEFFTSHNQPLLAKIIEDILSSINEVSKTEEQRYHLRHIIEKPKSQDQIIIRKLERKETPQLSLGQQSLERVSLSKLIQQRPKMLFESLKYSNTNSNSNIEKNKILGIQVLKFVAALYVKVKYDYEYGDKYLTKLTNTQLLKTINQLQKLNLDSFFINNDKKLLQYPNNKIDQMKLVPLQRIGNLIWQRLKLLESVVKGSILQQEIQQLQSQYAEIKNSILYEYKEESKNIEKKEEDKEEEKKEHIPDNEEREVVFNKVLKIVNSQKVFNSLIALITQHYNLDKDFEFILKTDYKQIQKIKMQSNDINQTEKVILVQRQDVFYDNRIQDDQGQRIFSDILFVKIFNNYIKTILINKYCRKLDYNRDISVFDLCSGKGGDQNKWLRQKMKHYVAMEQQECLIEQAMGRMIDKKDIRFSSIYVVGDAGDERNTIDKILENEAFKDIKKQIYFDLVSCQFSMHYLFETEAKARTFLHNVSCRLDPGGYFIATTVDAEKVTSLIRTKGSNLNIGNSCYSIQFGQDSLPKDGSPYGLKFYFYLKGAVGKERLSEDRPIFVPEYLVIIENLIQLAAEYNLLLVEKKNFMDFFQENYENNNENQNLYNRMVMQQIEENNTTQESILEQWEVCGLYLVLAFQKVKPQGYKNRYHDNFGNNKIQRKINVKDWI